MSSAEYFNLLTEDIQQQIPEDVLTTHGAQEVLRYFRGRIDQVKGKSPQTIGVHDADSLLECLKSNYRQAFPGLPEEAYTAFEQDSQSMIQVMAATIIELRRLQKLHQEVYGH